METFYLLAEDGSYILQEDGDKILQEFRDLLFSDGFESGDLSMWDDSDTGGGDLSAHADAAMHGSYGLKCVINDTDYLYVRDNSPDSENTYRARFFLDINSLSMADLDEFTILRANSSTENEIFFVGLQYTLEDGYNIFAAIKDDDGNYQYIKEYGVTDEPHFVEIYWEASDGGNNGRLELFIDGVSIDVKSGIDNDTKRIDYILLGVLSVGATTTGILYLDDFASNGDGIAIGGVTHQATLEGSLIFLGRKWSGLNIGMWSNAPYVNGDIDAILSNGFTEIRIDIPDWDNLEETADSKVTVLYAMSHGAKVIWGVSSYVTTLTSSNWSDFADAVKAAAQWAQDNGVYEFQIGNEEENHTDEVTIRSWVDLTPLLKALATEVQAIFTNGNVSYSCEQSTIDMWITDGKGDIDIIASNIYRGGGGIYDDGWKDRIDALYSEWGPDNTYLTEFSISYTSLADYSSSESVQALALFEMINYIRASGMARAFYFVYRSSAFGAILDSTYRQLWYLLIDTHMLTKKITKITAGILTMTGALSAAKYLLYKITAITIKCGTAITDKLKLRRIK